MLCADVPPPPTLHPLPLPLVPFSLSPEITIDPKRVLHDRNRVLQCYKAWKEAAGLLSLIHLQRQEIAPGQGPIEPNESTGAYSRQGVGVCLPESFNLFPFISLVAQHPGLDPLKQEYYNTQGFTSSKPTTPTTQHPFHLQGFRALWRTALILHDEKQERNCNP